MYDFEMKILVREALPADLPALLQVRYHDHPAIHRDRIDASDGHVMQYIVAEADQQLVGFGLLVLERPATWSDPLETFPALIDLFVVEGFRGHGIGSALIQYIEAAARHRGRSTMYLSVEPETNPRAMQLYIRSGYTPLQAQPYHNVWQFTDSDGNIHEGEEWLVDMCKRLEPPT